MALRLPFGDSQITSPLLLYSPPSCYGPLPPATILDKLNPKPTYKSLNELCWGVTMGDAWQGIANLGCMCRDGDAPRQMRCGVPFVWLPDMEDAEGTALYQAQRGPAYDAIAFCTRNCYCFDQLPPEPETENRVLTDDWEQARLKGWQDAWDKIGTSSDTSKCAPGAAGGSGAGSVPAAGGNQQCASPPVAETSECKAKCSSYNDCEVVRKKPGCSSIPDLVCSVQERLPMQFPSFGLCVSAALVVLGKKGAQFPKRELEQSPMCMCNSTFVSTECCTSKTGMIWDSHPEG